MAKGIRAGTVYINNYEEGVDTTIPLGRYKQSVLVEIIHIMYYIITFKLNLRGLRLISSLYII